MTAMKLFEAGETELLATLGLLDEIYTSMPRVRIAFDYHHTLWFMDEVEVTVGVAELGRTSLTFSFEAKRGEDVCVDGELVAVFVDEGGRPTPWSERLRGILSPA